MIREASMHHHSPALSALLPEIIPSHSRNSSQLTTLQFCSKHVVDGRCKFHFLNHHHHRRRVLVRAVKDNKTKEAVPSSSSSSPEEITKKYGLEAGLWKIFSSKEEENQEEEGRKEKSKSEQAKELLTKYGGAYLATSITLSLISFTLCYALITAGVDVSSLLQKVGISTNETGEKVGTLALAYAAHKAASPIRFPPTVALTPIVASWFTKKQP